MFSDRVLDDIRSAIKVSEIAQGKLKLARRGNGEFVVADNQSFTISDRKGLFHDFGSNTSFSKNTGDVIDLYQELYGVDFPEAVRELAERAGVQLDGANHSAGRNGAGRAHDRRGDDVGAADSGSDRRASGDAKPRKGSQGGKLEIVKTWDILSPENDLLYQTVRRQRLLPNGEWELNKDGKVWKTFSQRRPSPDNDGTWVWSLDLSDRESGMPLKFMRLKDGWLRFNEENFAKWGLSETREWPDAKPFEPWLYGANDVIDELREPAGDQREIFFPEGEAKVDVLKEWDLLAVSATGGAKHFTPECAEFFRGARHVIILQDNDRAGAERVAKVGPMLKAVGVQQISALNFHDFWPGCPNKGDVKDWRDKGGGTREQLLEIVDKLKPWVPEPYKSKFGAKTARDLGEHASAYPWRIKHIAPKFDDMLIMGPSRSGKTFETLDMVMHVHDGETFAGKRVEACGVIVLTYEGATGFENRLRAYLKHHGKTVHDLHSFAWITRPPGLYASEENVEQLADEINKIAENFVLPLGVVVIDTHNAATKGSSEIKSEDIGKIVQNYARLKDKTGASNWIVGHTNAEGKHRGNEQFFNGIETALLIERVTEKKGKDIVEKRDDQGRILRRAKISKQREGDDRLSWEFVLSSVVLGVDMDGDEITSMVSVDPARKDVGKMTTDRTQQAADPQNGFKLRDIEADIFKLMLKEIDEAGESPPAALNLPPSTRKVIKWAELSLAYRKKLPEDMDADSVKKRLTRFREVLQRYGVIAADSVTFEGKQTTYIWPTGKRVWGAGLGVWPPLPREKKKQDDAPLIDQATGKPIDDVVF